MSFSVSAVESLIDSINTALDSGHLNEWETRFVTNIRGELKRHGTNTRLSFKQADKLEEILGPPNPSSNVISLEPRLGRKKSKWQNPPRNVKTTGRKSRSRTRYKRRFSSYRINKYYIPMVVIIAMMCLSLYDFVAQGWLERYISKPAVLSQQKLSRSDFTVTDGDTIRIKGERKGTRLVGFNTPETFEPVCDRGLALGREATQRLKELVANAGSIEIEKVACACLPGTQGTRECNYGRSCGILRTDGQDVGRILISEGLAASFKCGRTSCPPTPKPWCK